MNEKQILDMIDRVNADGPFKPDWDSLAARKVPAWFGERKLGIFIHWGAYAVPAATNEWYPRNMYKQDMPAFAHHRKVYGEQKDVGYKDLIEMFKAEHFDAEAWIALFKAAGAGYIFPVAEHHDGFQMYDSDLSDWNAVKKGPHRDVVGELRRAALDAGLEFCTSSHRAEHWWFMSHGLEFDSDIVKPLHKGDLYWPAMPEPADHQDRDSKPWPSQEYMDDWLARTAEIIVKYRPSLLYFDWWISHHAFESHLKRLAAFYYNCGAAWGKDVAICFKHEAMPEPCGIPEVERGGFERIMPFAWQTDTAVARNSWCYTDTLDYKSTAEILCALVDTVSKGGNMLLNVGPKADGTFAPGDMKILTDMAGWMEKFGDTLKGARPWHRFGEGPTEQPHGEFSDQKPIAYTSADFRFYTANDKVYAAALRPAADGRYAIASMGADAWDKRVKAVRIAGRDVAFTQKGDALHVSAPAASGELPVVIEITI